MGLAVCSGCDIGNCLDAESLCSLMAGQAEGIVCMHHPALCSEEGLGKLHRMVRDKKLDRLAIGACSPRVKSSFFQMDGVLVERINLREQVTWVMEAGSEDARMCAEDYIRMGLAKLAQIASPAPYVPEKIAAEIVVLGGGVTGLTAAVQGASAGYRVHLVEKTDRLGGYANRIHKLSPVTAGHTALCEPDVASLAALAESHPLVEIHLNSTLASVSGEPGNFTVELDDGAGTVLRAGSLVVASGWKPYDPSRLQTLGYGSTGQVKTLEEFEQFAGEGKIPERVLFMLCAGSRDKDHLPYCSAYCCGAALKQALYVRESNPGSEVYIVYRDIRTTGFQEDFYRSVQSDEAIFMTRGQVESVRQSGQALEVTVLDSSLGERIRLETDMVVLATGMVPSTTTDLNLQYRLGKGLPELKYAFSDSHFICFPYETRRTGIYAAGTVRAPMDIESSREDGAGAMLKAIQCIECVSRGESVHPRTGDRSWPELYMERCTDCKRCTEECPFGSYDETEKGTPLPNPARCRRCGICVGSCPERVISFADFSIQSISAMIKAIPVPDEFAEKPRILVFVCENDAYPALDTAGMKRLKLTPYARIIPVRCLGSVNSVWIKDALAQGFDGVLLIGCMPGDDYQCHFIHGSELTEKRGENLGEALRTMMLEPERIRTRFVEITGHHEICKMINEYAEAMEALGPNPYKGM
ncbi:MAG TPA: hydrogenase iron-sulfur subunit [Bacteroides sp.]|nr:hydrogenase iron-sulfur subunit [Bacteroides sp.]